MEDFLLESLNKEISNLGINVKVNPKTDIIESISYYSLNGNSVNLDILKKIEQLVLKQSIHHINQLRLNDIYLNETPLFPRELHLLRKVYDLYFGTNQIISQKKDLICTCFNISKSDIKKLVLNDYRFDLNTLVKETHATSACGTCLNKTVDYIEQVRAENGLIKGLKNNRNSVDKDGKWIKVKGLYPAELLIKLDDYKAEWLKQNSLVGIVDLNFIELQGLHLVVDTRISDEFKKKVLIEAFEEFIFNELGIKIFVHST